MGEPSLQIDQRNFMMKLFIILAIMAAVALSAPAPQEAGMKITDEFAAEQLTSNILAKDIAEVTYSRSKRSDDETTTTTPPPPPYWVSWPQVNHLFNCFK